MALRGLTPLAVFFFGSVVAFGCGGATDTDFSSDDGSAGGSAGEGGNGGSSQGGSSQGGSSQGGASGSSGAGGSSQGGSDPNGGSSTGGTPNGGASGTETGGAMTGGAGGTGAGGGSGGSVGGSGGTGTGGAGTGGAPMGGTGGLPSDCARTIAEAQAALTSAQVCDPNTDGPKCTGKVEDLCDCVVPVNDAASELTEKYLGLREAAIKCGVPCLAIVCPEPTAVMCGFGGVTTNIVGVRAQCRYSPR